MDAIARFLSLFSMDAEALPEDDPCPICYYDFHDRAVAPVVVKTQCGHRFHLDCIARDFVERPIGLRRCAICRQNPMPVVNENTNESYPDKFFPDRAFFNACSEGDSKKVIKSLAEGVNVNVAVVGKGFTALMLATAKGHKEVVEHLTKGGAGLDTARTVDGVTSLHIAVRSNSTACVQALITAGAELDAPLTTNGATPLWVAALENNTDCLQALITAGAGKGKEESYCVIL
ncbi:ankyrin repeat domain-containing protein [Endozoicomonas sp. YOMI1]|uniref:ankyrin repeat domain-containing protein n=1 Tax=Endozoicomonas sp. YOMI1 TaxID=2828739 RepID=UPI0021489F48|nr:ankyrin repeat domain-containing protein [Endozoicomonas sp. YOMI1]